MKSLYVRWKEGRLPADFEHPILDPPIRGIIVPQIISEPAESNRYKSDKIVIFATDFGHKSFASIQHTMWISMIRKDRESLRLFAESKALRTCFDLTIFSILAEFAI